MLNREKFNAAIFRRGSKPEKFGDGDDEEDVEDLKHKLEDLHEIWGLPREGKEFSAAIWRPQHRAAEVVLQKGRLFSHMGFMWGKKLFLHIEEALYLMDRANLMMFLDHPKTGKQIMSLQEAQEIMLNTGVTMDMYIIYCKLMRAGYIVQRHPSTWIVKQSETPTEIWKAPVTYRKDLPPKNGLFPPSAAELAPVAAPADAAPPPAKRARVEPSGAVPSTETGVQGSGRWWTSAAAWAGAPAAHDADALPRCEVVQHPLQRAQQLFPNMQPLHHLAPAELTDPGAANREGTAMLHYDVYLANSQFSRKVPGDPIFMLCVFEGSSAPALTASNAVDGAATVPVRYARVEAGDVSFFALARTELKNILR